MTTVTTASATPASPMCRKARRGIRVRTGLPRGLASLLPTPARPCPATWRPMLLQQLLLLPGWLEVRLSLGRGRVLPPWLGRRRRCTRATAWAPAPEPWGFPASRVCRDPPSPAPAPVTCREAPAPCREAPAPAKGKGILRGGQACRGVCLGMKQLPHCAQCIRQAGRQGLRALHLQGRTGGR